MIGIDIDGVFIADLTWDNDKTDTLLDIRNNHTVPVFVPEGAYVLITGRPQEDAQATLAWVEKNFTNLPAEVFHANPDFRKAAEYKASVLNSNPHITKFIESDEKQVERIKELLDHDVEVILFRDIILKAMANL
jgi:hypothetical protein